MDDSNSFLSYDAAPIHESAVTACAASADLKAQTHSKPRSSNAFVTLGRDIKACASFAWRKPRNFWLHTGLLFLAITALTSSSWFLLVPAAASGTYCAPGGNFDFQESYDRWASEHVFQITVGFGRLSFTKVKVIDVAWDIIIGRGGQFALSWITWIVFSKSLNRMLEQPHAAVSYDTFRAILFERPTLSSTLKLPKDLRRRLGWRAHCSIMWFVLASMYIIAFPTITSAMTGYSSNVDPYFQTDSGGQKDRLVSKSFSRAIYLINDTRVNQLLNTSGPYLVGSEPFHLPRTTPEEEYGSCLLSSTQNHDNGSWIVRSDSTTSCQMAFGVSEYIKSYGSRPLSSVSSNLTFNGTTHLLGPPTLDVKIFNTRSNSVQFNDDRYDRLSCGENNTVRLASFMYTHDGRNTPYTAVELNSLGSCDSATTYMWGFSFLLLFGFFIATGLWVMGMYAMWSDAFWNSRLDVIGRQTGFYRAVTDVNNSMRRDALQKPTDLDSESKIRQALAERRNGGKVGYDDIDRDKLPLPRSNDLKVWTKGIASFHGWTRPWRLLQWLNWLLIFFVGSIFVLIAFYAGWSAGPVIALLFSASLFVVGLLFFLLFFILSFTGLCCSVWRRSKTLRRSLPESARRRRAGAGAPLADNASDTVQLVESSSLGAHERKNLTPHISSGRSS